MAVGKDKQIFWIVLLALAYWAVTWKHEAATKFVHKASQDIVGIFHTRRVPR